MDYSQFLAMRQEIGVFLVFLLVFLYDTFMPKKALNATAGFTAILFSIFTVASFVWGNVGTVDAFAGMYSTSPVCSMIKNILNVGVVIVLIQSVRWTNGDMMVVRRGEFYELLLVTLFGMYLMISARHFLLFVIGLECASLPLAAMVAFEKNRYESHEAAIKYILTAVFSSAVFMMGLSFVYGLTGSLYFDSVAASLSASAGAVVSPLLVVALAFVISGVGFKLSLVPFHLWTADVYHGAPTSVTSYLSVISKGAAAFAFLVILTQVFGAVYSQVWEWMLYALIVLTITVGNLFALRQTNMKRFLAFSSISQAGYIMLGIVGDNAMGMASLMFYILVYVFSNLAAFGVIQAIENQTGKLDRDDYRGLYKSNPHLSVVMMLAMFSLAGIPPFAGFFSKFFIFAGALQGTESIALYVLVLIALINTIPSLFYYLLVVKAMFLSSDEPVIPAFRSACSERVGMWVTVAGILLLGVVSCFYNEILTMCQSYGLVSLV